MFSHKPISINLFILLLGLTVIGFLNEFQFQSAGKVLTYISIVLFFVIFFNSIFIENYRLSISIFFLLLFILYFSSYKFGSFPSTDFIKKFIQILICFFILIFFVVNKIRIQTDLLILPIISVGLFLFFILALDNILENDFLYFFSYLFSENNISEFYENNLSNFSLNEFWIENNPYTILLNIILFYLLCKKDFNKKTISQIGIIIFLIFFSENTFSKFVMIILLSTFFLKRKNEKFFLFFVIFFFSSIIFFILSLVFFYDNLIFMINSIYEYFFLNFMDEKINEIDYNFLATSNENKVIFSKIISILSFKGQEFFQPFNDTTLKRTTEDIHLYNKDISNFYYNYYFGLISRISILKIKISEISTNTNMYDFSDLINIKIFGIGYAAAPAGYVFPEVVNEWFEYKKNVNSENFLNNCLNNFDLNTGCGKKFIDETSYLKFYGYNLISQNLSSTHNTWLTLVIILKKFIFLFFLIFLLFFVYCVRYKKIELLFIILSVFLIFVFEDYLFFNRYNLSLIFWLIMSQIIIDLSIKNRIN